MSSPLHKESPRVQAACLKIFFLFSQVKLLILLIAVGFQRTSDRLGAHLNLFRRDEMFPGAYKGNITKYHYKRS